MVCLERLVDECIVPKFSCEQSFGLPHMRYKLTQQRSDMVVIRLMVSKQTFFFFLPVFRHIILVITGITNVSILVYQCIKPGSELSKILIASTEN